MEKLGVGLSGQSITPLDIVECASLADKLGYHSFWLSEGHGGDMFSVLTACALNTKNILLGTSISSVFVRSAPTIAMAAACVDHFSRGRFILGLGSSHRVQVEGEHGLEYSRPVQRVRETVDIVRRLLKDGEVSYQGEAFHIDRFGMWFPRLRDEIPIYLGAVFPRMLQIAGELAQGAILTWTTVENARKASQNLLAGARQAGKKPKDVELVALLSASVAPDDRPDLDGLRQGLAFYAGFFPRYNRMLAQSGFPTEASVLRQAFLQGKRGPELAKLVPNSMLRATALIGSPDNAKRRIAEYRQAGITLPVISPRFTGPVAKARILETIRLCAP